MRSLSFQSTRASEDARDEAPEVRAARLAGFNPRARPRTRATFLYPLDLAAVGFQSTRASEDARDVSRGGNAFLVRAVSIHARVRGRARLQIACVGHAASEVSIHARVRGRA